MTPRASGAEIAGAALAGVVRGAWLAGVVLVGISAYFARREALEQQAMGSTGLSVREARDILGVPDRASTEEIVAAYRRLMRTAHPDHGGSTVRAAQLNAARDRLLG